MSRHPAPDVVSAALAYLRGGFSALPCRLPDKHPLVKWKALQQEPMPEAAVPAQFGEAGALGVVCGAVSGGLEVLDFDVPAFFPAWRELVENHAPDLAARLPVYRTPSGGFHVWYRCVTPGGNTKLAYARTDDGCGEIAIETRGEGGYVVAAPSPGYEREGPRLPVPHLTDAEHEMLLDLARSLDELPPSMPESAPPAGDGVRPGDDFNERGQLDAKDALRRAGWSIARTRSDGVEEWVRPGKTATDGHSATFGAPEAGGDFYVFSTNAAPFDGPRVHRPFGIVAALDYGGDFAAAARALAGKGYGAAGGDMKAKEQTGDDAADEPEPEPRRDERNGDRSARKATRAARPLHELGFVCINDVVVEPVDWLWEEWIPRAMLSICDGRPDAGKTTMLCDIAARVTRGHAMPTESSQRFAREPEAVIFMTSENVFAQVLRPRLEAAGADMTLCHGWQATPDEEGLPDCPRLPRDSEILGRAVREYGAALVIVDPLFTHMDEGLNPNRDTDVRRALVPLARIAEESGAAVVAVRHFNKSANGDAINAGSGSIGIVGTARSLLMVGKPPETPDESPERVVAVAKMNIAVKPQAYSFSIVSADGGGVSSSRVEWGGVSTSTAADLTRARGGDARMLSPARDEAAQWLRDLLSAGDVSSSDVFDKGKADGHSKKTLYRASDEIGVEKYRKGFGGAWWWGLRDSIDGQDGQAVEDDSLDTETVGIYDNRGHLWENEPETRSVEGPPEEAEAIDAILAHDLGNGGPLAEQPRHGDFSSGDGLPDGDLLQIDIPDEDDEVNHA